MNRTILILAPLILLSACASAPSSQPPRVERMTAEQLAATLPQPSAAVSLDDIVAMSHQGQTPKQIIDRIRETHSRYRLSAEQIIDLHGKGVAPAVLDHMVDAERQGIFDDMAGEIAKRDQSCRDTIERQVGLCRAQCTGGWAGSPMMSDCWPPRPGYSNTPCF